MILQFLETIQTYLHNLIKFILAENPKVTMNFPYEDPTFHKEMSYEV